MTLDKVELSVEGIFECGQLYVALSRVRSLKGLYLKDFDPKKVMVNEKVKKFHASLQ
jgi:ATP-dependent DNA helicase PIF1